MWWARGFVRTLPGNVRPHLGEARWLLSDFGVSVVNSGIKALSATHLLAMAAPQKIDYTNVNPSTLKDLSDDKLFDLIREPMMGPVEGWKLKQSDAKSGLCIYSRPNPNPNIGFAQFLAIVSLPLTVEEACDLIHRASSRLEWDSFMATFMELRPDLVYFTTVPIGALWGRSFIDRRIIRTLPDGSSICACTSVESDLAPKNSGLQRAWNYTNGVAIIPTNAGCTVRMLACSDARGWMPQSISEWGTPKAMLRILSKMHEVAVKRVESKKSRTK